MSNDLIIPDAVEAGELSIRRAPDKVLAEAQEAAKALQDVISRKARPVKFNNEQYIEFEDWQTIGRFYGLSAKVIRTAPIVFGDVTGFEADAVVIDVKTGQEVSRAEAMCLNDEGNWKSKPLFQLRSMAQTRACAKAFRNVLAWVVVLAGYRPTPAEELPETGEHGETGNGAAPSKPAVAFQPNTPYTGILVDYVPAIQVPKGQKGNKPQRVVVDVEGSELVIGGFDLPEGLLAPVVGTWKGERVTVSYILDRSGKFKNLTGLTRATENLGLDHTEPPQEGLFQATEAMGPYLDTLRLCESHKEVSGVIREYQKDAALSSEEKGALTKAANVKLQELEAGQG